MAEGEIDGANALAKSLKNQVSSQYMVQTTLQTKIS